jgi:predicted tellurium resistance membrane protein TerC
MEVFLNPDAWITYWPSWKLSGIDNIILFQLTGKLPVESRKKATKIGMFLAMFMRIALLSVSTYWFKWKTWFSIDLMVESRNYGTKYHIASGGLFLI